MKKDHKPCVSIVVIGKNEMRHLSRCFSSIKDLDYPNDKIELIYVDSGSCDRSVDIAKKYTDKVIVEKTKFQTAGNARNKGLNAARFDYIHFVDGDTQLFKGYLERAIRLLSAGDIMAVSGFVVEKKGFFNKLLSSYRLSIKEGYVGFLNCGGTFHKRMLMRINGYDRRILRGQETELAERIVRQGNKIYYTTEPMAMHDFEGDLISYIHKMFRCGVGLGYNSLLSGESEFFRRERKAAIKNLFHNLIFILILVGLVRLGSPRTIFAAIGLFGCLIFLKSFFIKRKRNGYEIANILLMNFCKPIMCCGQIVAYFNYCVFRDIRQILMNKAPCNRN